MNRQQKAAHRMAEPLLPPVPSPPLLPQAGRPGWTPLPSPAASGMTARPLRPDRPQHQVEPSAQEPGAATVEAIRQAIRQMLASRNGPTLDKSPRRPRRQMEAGPGGWHLRLELPGVPPESVALWVSHGALMVAATGSCAYAVRLPLPPEADPASLRWHCAHGLLQAHLAPYQPNPEAEA